MNQESEDRSDTEITINLKTISDAHRNWVATIESISRALSLAAIPIVLGVVGFLMQARLAEQGVKPEYVRIAVTLLQETDEKKVPPSLRLWAADVLNQNSPTKLPTSLLSELKSGETSLPMSRTLVTGSIGVSPGNILRGQSAALSWNSFNATEVSIAPGIGAVGPSGSIFVSP